MASKTSSRGTGLVRRLALLFHRVGAFPNLSRILPVLTLILLGCTERVSDATPSRILVMGDSLLAVNRGIGSSVADGIEAVAMEEVTDRAVSGARILYLLPLSGAAGLKIARQYREGDWDWIVLNGGGNDLLFGCGCLRCDGTLDRLIAGDGSTGAIPDLVSTLRQTGAQVIWVGYLRSPGVLSPIEGCAPLGDALDARVGKLAAQDKGVHFVPLADLVPSGDRSFHAPDRIHPSPKGSMAIGARIAALISTAEAARPGQ